MDQRLEGHQRRFGLLCAGEHDAPRGVDRRRDRQGQRLRAAEGLRRAKVHTLVCMGLDNAKLVRVFTGVVPEVVSTDSLEAAMTASKAAARPGDAVLLSPACASFDLFRNYENRGELFKNWVEEKA